jgi:hypothetical protein
LNAIILQKTQSCTNESLKQEMTHSKRHVQ